MNLTDLTIQQARDLARTISDAADASRNIAARIGLFPDRLEIRWGTAPEDRRTTALAGLRAALDRAEPGLAGLAARDQAVHSTITETPAEADSSPAQTEDEAGVIIPTAPAATDTPAQAAETGEATDGQGDAPSVASGAPRAWTQAEDDELVAEAVKRGPGYVASLLCRFMAPKLGRSEGAVKLRLYRSEIADRIADGHEAQLRAPKVVAEPASKLTALAVPDNWSRAADLAMCEDLFRGVNLKRQADEQGVTFQFLSKRFDRLKIATIGRAEMSPASQKTMLAALREVV